MSTTNGWDVLLMLAACFGVSAPLCFMMWLANKDDRHD